jgi:hypothetical protein
MKTLTKLSIIAVASFWSTGVFAAGNAGVACPSTVVLDGGQNDTVLAAGGYFQCDDTPDMMQVKFYKLGLCKTKPTFDNYGDCTFIFDNAAGKTVNLAVGVSDNLIDEISLSEGEYPYAMLVISNTLGMKKKLTFDTAISSMNGSVGKYCVTNGEPHTFAPNALDEAMFDCSTNANATAELSNVTFEGFFNDDYGVVQGASIFVTELLDLEASLGAKFDVMLVDTEGTQSMATANLNQFGSPYPVSNATRMWGVQTFTTPVKIDANTTNLDVGFSIQDGSLFNFGGYCDPNNSLGDQHCLEMANIASFEFIVNVE